MRQGNSLEHLLAEKETVEDLLWDHKLDISGSVHKRMEELGISQAELASKMKMDRAQLSKILSGEGNITLKTIARFEVALDFKLDSGFRYRLNPITAAVTIHKVDLSIKMCWDSWEVGTANTVFSNKITEDFKATIDKINLVAA